MASGATVAKAFGGMTGPREWSGAHWRGLQLTRESIGASSRPRAEKMPPEYVLLIRINGSRYSIRDKGFLDFIGLAN
jgi:hypothetical protein